MSLFTTIKRGLNRTKTIAVFLFMFSIAIFSFYQEGMYYYGLPTYFVRSAYENTLIQSLNSKYMALIIMIVGPLLISFAFGDIYFDDLESNCISLITTRENKRKYHKNNIIAVFILSFIIVFIPIIINLILCLITYPLEGIDNSTLTPAFIVIYKKGNTLDFLRVFHPLAYSIIYTIIPSLIFALFSCITYCLSMIISVNKYLCIFISYGIYIGYNIFMEKLNMSNYTLFNYMNMLSSNGGIGPFISIIFILIITIVTMYFIGIKREAEVH